MVTINECGCMYDGECTCDPENCECECGCETCPIEGLMCGCGGNCSCGNGMQDDGIG
jgi:hypothetical protein|tara:strand:+ start:196 stop:366 length:171 start_codon:yes stop_codon:yes gene_type:complete